MARISIATSRVVTRGSGTSVARAVSRSVSGGGSVSSSASVGNSASAQSSGGAADQHECAEASTGGSTAVAEGWASGPGADVKVDAKVEDGK